MAEIKADIKLNLEGLMCPMPVVRVSKAIASITELVVNAIIKAVNDSGK